MVIYVSGCYRLTPGLQCALISYFTPLESFFKIGYVCIIPKGMEQYHTQFADLILCDDSTGCDEMGNYFATEAYTMINIVCEVDLINDWF